MNCRFFLSMLLAAGALLSACTPKVVPKISKAQAPLATNADVAVINLGAPDPSGAEVIGTVRIGDNGFTSDKNGSYENVIALAKAEARKVGGNAIRITSHQSPDATSNVHRIQATILRVKDPSKLVLDPQPAHSPQEAGTNPAK